MHNNNEYWGMGYRELEELELEFRELYKAASSRRDFEGMRKFQREIDFIIDAMAAYERGES